MLNMFVAKNADGRLEVFVVVASPFGVMGHVWQKAPSNGWYQTWDSLAGNWDTHSEVITASNQAVKKTKED